MNAFCGPGNVLPSLQLAIGWAKNSSYRGR